jgi:hypothetical protein
VIGTSLAATNGKDKDNAGPKAGIVVLFVTRSGDDGRGHRSRPSIVQRWVGG